MKLSGKVALVTGSSRGIGAAIVKSLAKEGAQVVINYLKSEDRARQVLEEVKSFGAQAIMVQADVSKEADISRLVDESNRAFGKIDICVHNAVTLTPLQNLFLETKWEEVAKALDISLKAPFQLFQAVVPGMKDRKWGRLINIGSDSFFHHNRARYGYWVAKGAALALVRNLARELAPYGITVNTVIPGLIETEIIPRNKELIDAIIREIQAIPRLGQTEDVAAAVLFFASDESSFITGDALYANGGGVVLI